MTQVGSQLTKSVSFHVACVPPKASHHAKRIVRIGQFSRLADKPELVAAKATLDALLLPHQPAAPVGSDVPRRHYGGPVPVALEVVYTWPWLASHSARVRAAGRVPMTSKPDLDNVTKSLIDRLMALRFIEDDSNVVDLHVRKFWGSEPGISVVIRPFPVRF